MNNLIRGIKENKGSIIKGTLMIGAAIAGFIMLSKGVPDEEELECVDVEFSEISEEEISDESTEE